jgi:hypothetical protein
MGEFREQRQRVIESVAGYLVERATGMPAYLVDEETFAGWEAAARQAVEKTPRPVLSSIAEACERARGGQLSVDGRIFSDWCSAAKATALEASRA